MKIRTTIVDDEFLARERLKKLLCDEDDIQIISEAKTGQDAINQIRDLEPDLVFLDIKMPDINGFDVIRGLPKSKIPQIIFSTAYDQFAIDAFRVEALDYLLKPFDEERLQESLSKLRRQVKFQKSSDFEAKLRNLLKAYEAEKSQFREQFLIKEKGIEFNISLENTIYISAEGNYIKLVCLDRSYLYRASMNQVQEDIDPRIFLRIHRSLLLNVHRIESWKYKGNNEFEFKMKNGEFLHSGRSYRDQIQSFFSPS